MGVDREALRVWLVASCAAQGVPVAVTDPVVIAQVGVLLRGRDAAGQPPAGGDRSARPSQPPRDTDSVRIDIATSSGSGSDGAEVHHGPDDRSLTGQRKSVPARAQLVAVTGDPVEGMIAGDLR